MKICQISRAYLQAAAGSGQRSGQFRIISAGGAVMATFGSEAPGTIYIVPVRDWAAGVYYVQYLEEVRCGRWRGL